MLYWKEEPEKPIEIKRMMIIIQDEQVHTEEGMCKFHFYNNHNFKF